MSNGNGGFTIANVQASASGSSIVLDGSSGSTVVDATADGAPGQQWDVQTGGDGFFYLVNQASGAVLSAHPGQTANTVAITGAGSRAEWAITPVAISNNN